MRKYLKNNNSDIPLACLFYCRLHIFHLSNTSLYHYITHQFKLCKNPSNQITIILITSIKFTKKNCAGHNTPLKQTVTPSPLFTQIQWTILFESFFIPLPTLRPCRPHPLPLPMSCHPSPSLTSPPSSLLTPSLAPSSTSYIYRSLPVNTNDMYILCHLLQLKV